MGFLGLIFGPDRLYMIKFPLFNFHIADMIQQKAALADWKKVKVWILMMITEEQESLTVKVALKSYQNDSK